jgi:hypothetical protein
MKQLIVTEEARIFWRSKHKFIIAKNPNPNDGHSYMVGFKNPKEI